MITERSKAIILLTGYLPSSDKKAKPLSISEWNKFAIWLHQRDLVPEDLLGFEQNKIIKDWNDNKILKERLEKLLNRGATMAICLDKWQRAGVWVINRSDSDYPRKFKKALNQKSPPIFYGIGNKKLLSTEAIGVVGSRNITEEELKYSYDLGVKIAGEGLSVVSGGAKGIDEYSMVGALQSEGTSIGILADRLLQRSTSKVYRKHIMNNNLVFISPYHPEARFNVGNAMSRNKFIYLKSNATYVVHSGIKGGTWTGALENLQYKWVPLFVKSNNYPNSGNSELIKKGGTIFNGSVSEIKFTENKVENSQQNLSNNIEQNKILSSKINNSTIESNSIYKFKNPLLEKFSELLKNDFSNGFSNKEVSKHYSIVPSQIKKWLNQLEKSKIIKTEEEGKFKFVNK